MNSAKFTTPNLRVAFLLLLALGFSFLFLWLIHGFILALIVAMALAGLAHPLYLRVASLLGQRRVIASGFTVLLSLFLVVIPLFFFVGALVNQSVSIAELAQERMSEQKNQVGKWEKKLAASPQLKKLLPYQDKIVAKSRELASKASAWVAAGLAAGARGTAEFLLLVFVMLYSMFFFLIYGRQTLDTVLSYAPISTDDQKKLVGTFLSVSRATLKGTLIIGLLQGGLAGLSFWVAGIHGVIFWSVVMAVLSVIPGIGSALIWVPTVIYLFLQGQHSAAIGVALWCALVVGTIDNVLRPILVGKDTEMPDLLVLLTTLGGLAMFGISGILVGPLIGALLMASWKLWGGAKKQLQG